MCSEVVLLLGLSVVYMIYRGRTPAPPFARSPLNATFPRPNSPANLPGGHSSSVRERATRTSHSHSLTASTSIGLREDGRKTSPSGTGEDVAMIGAKGCVWGTEDRDYRSVGTIIRFIECEAKSIGTARTMGHCLLFYSHR